MGAEKATGIKLGHNKKNDTYSKNNIYLQPNMAIIIISQIWE